ncbi:MAG: hypothetical protein IJY94_04840, partial [Clostridia bacterium]|nr:hypothetical protein [Clostridia bacterium]
GARVERDYRALSFSLGRFRKYLLSSVSRPMAPSVSYADSSLPEGAIEITIPHNKNFLKKG